MTKDAHWMTADMIDGAVDHVGDGFTYLAERMGSPVSERQAAAMMLLLEDQGCDVRHLLRTDRWADEDPAEDLSDDDWSALVCSACDLAAANPTTNIGWLAKRAAEAVWVPDTHQRVEQVIIDTLSVDGVELVGSYMESVCEFSGPHGPVTVRFRFTRDTDETSVVTSVEVSEVVDPGTKPPAWEEALAHAETLRAQGVDVGIDEGQRSIEIFGTDGELHDPDDGTPAVQVFYPDGTPKWISHYTNGKCHDPDDGTPAFQVFHPDGTPKWIGHWTDGKLVSAESFPPPTGEA